MRLRALSRTMVAVATVTAALAGGATAQAEPTELTVSVPGVGTRDVQICVGTGQQDVDAVLREEACREVTLVQASTLTVTAEREGGTTLALADPPCGDRFGVMVVSNAEEKDTRVTLRALLADGDPQTPDVSLGTSEDGETVLGGTYRYASVCLGVPGAGPATVLESAPQELTNERVARFTFASPDSGVSFECALDGDPQAPEYGACSSPVVETVDDGTHVFRVRAVTATGRRGTAATHTWTVDSVAPGVTIQSAPTGTVTAGDATLEFASDELESTFECSLDGGSFSPCVSPHTYSDVGQGAHSVIVRATDAAGNSAQAERHWVVDSEGPATEITNGPSGTVTARTATFGFSASDASSFECSLDGGPFAACASPWSSSALALGEHRFAVRAIDALGNVGAVASRTWTIAGSSVATASPQEPAPAPVTESVARAGSAGAVPVAGTVPAPKAASPVATLSARMTISRRRLRTVLRRGLRVSLSCSSSCRVVGDLRAKGVRLARIGSKSSSRQHTFTVRLQRAVRRGSRIVVSAVVIDASGARRTVRSVVTLRT